MGIGCRAGEKGPQRVTPQPPPRSRTRYRVFSHTRSNPGTLASGAIARRPTQGYETEISQLSGHKSGVQVLAGGYPGASPGLRPHRAFSLGVNPNPV